MAKLTLSDLASLANETTAITTINNNNQLIEDAIEDALLRTDVVNDEMESNLDMNGYRVLNLPAPQTDQEPLRLADADSLVGTTITINNEYDPSVLTAATPASGDLLGFADISDTNALKKATLTDIVAAGISATPTFTSVTATTGTLTTGNITTGNITTANVTNLDAGASGTAGTADIFPATASKGKIQITATDSVGNTTTTITNASQAGAVTYTIPDAGASANFVMSEGAATINGIKTFGSMFRIPYNGSVAAAGSVQGDAAALSEGLSVVTGANGTVGVILPTAVAGAIVVIKGTTAGVLKVWPATGAQINAVGANTAMSFASGAVPAILIATSSTQWYTFPLLPS